jgi:DNA-binding transcriptional LysR family regulator
MDHAEQGDIAAGELVDLELIRRFIVVAEERNFGRAAARLHMTQPPLSRAIRQLETDLGAVLLDRSSTPLTLTGAGAALYEEARLLLDQAEHVRARVAATAGTATLTIGIVANSAEQAGPRLTAAFRHRHPGVQVSFREADFSDPTAGLRAGLTDVAITRTPFDDTGISTHALRVDRIGVVLRADDPLAGRGSLRVAELGDRRWFRLPDGTDPIWRAYWEATPPGGERRTARWSAPCTNACRPCCGTAASGWPRSATNYRTA